MGKKRKRSAYGHGSSNDALSDSKDGGNEGYHDEQPPIEGAFRYNFQGDLPWDFQKYWRQRFDIFSLYNDGVWMTEDSWFEVTPEAIANKISQHVTAAIPGVRSIIVDAFCGIGGNTIAFALSGKFKRVYAIEKNEAALACAKHNAEIYGVSNQITWFLGDCFELLGVGSSKKQNTVTALQQVINEFGVVFASPPWGGPGYKSAEIFDLNQMQPYTLTELYNRFSDVSKNIVLYLPRTSDLRQLSHYAKDNEKTQVIHYCTNGVSRALCIYYGDWKAIPSGDEDHL